jgi:hypothetical protein
MTKTTRARLTKTPRTPLGDAGTTILRGRTGGEALGTVMAAPAPPASASRWGKGRNQAGFKVTTIRLMPDEWVWLRQQALAHAMESGTVADASAIVRGLVRAAMGKESTGKRAAR